LHKFVHVGCTTVTNRVNRNLSNGAASNIDECMTLHVVARQSVQCLNEMIRLRNNYAQPFSGFITFYNDKKSYGVTVQFGGPDIPIMYR